MRWNFRLRTLMLAVAVAAVLGWLAIGLATDVRRSYYRGRSELFAYGEADVLDQIVENLAAARRAEASGPEGSQRAAALRAEAERLARLAAWHVKLEQKYARAVDHPWESLPPDKSPP
jgi:hypothetical protein